MKHYNHILTRIKKESKLKNIFRSPKTTIALVGIIGTGLILNSIIARDYLKPRDFEKANWIMYDNQNGRIWSCYTNEDIPHNQTNWYAYLEEVRKANRDSLEGMIILPDLDRDGKVGK